MLRNLRSLFRRVKRNPASRPQARLMSHPEQIAHLERRNAALAGECMDQAGYIRFLTGQCIMFECDRIIRQAERGELV